MRCVIGIALGLLALGLGAAPLHGQGRGGKLMLLGGIPGARVQINGAPAGRLPLRHAIRVPAGVVELEVQARGYRLFIRRIEVPARRRVRFRVELTRKAPRDPSQNDHRQVLAQAPPVVPPPPPPVPGPARPALGTSPRFGVLL